MPRNMIWMCWTCPRPATGNSLAIRADVAQEYGIGTISDLQSNADKIRFGSTSDFYEREDGMLGLEKVYGEFAFASENSFDNSLKYQVMASDEVDCVPAYTTDAQAEQRRVCAFRG